MRPYNRPALRLSEALKRLVIQLRVEGEAPRIRLAQMLGMNGATVTRLTQQLITLDLVEEGEVANSAARGRPMVPLQISGRGGWSVGATAHPGWLELALVDFRGRMLVKDSVPFESPDPRDFARLLDQRLRALAADHGFMRGKFLGLGVAVPGYALGGDPSRRVVVQRLAGWTDVPLAELFSDMLSMPVWIENDANAAALAEYYQPHIITRHRSALVLFLGHGIGGGLIAARDQLLGEHGNAGEVGRLFPGHVDRPSGIDLIRTLRQAGVAITSLSDLEPLIGLHESVLTAWVLRVADQLDTAIQSGVAWFDPGAVIISGALPQPILRALTDRLIILNASREDGYRAEKPAIYASPIGSAAVVTGAAMAPIHAITAPDFDS